MITYADSSVLVAWFHADDEFALSVTKWVQEEVADFIWNPVLRAEVRQAELARELAGSPFRLVKYFKS